MVRGIANSKIGFGDLILLLRYFFKLKVSTHPTFYSDFVSGKSHIVMPFTFVRICVESLELV